MASKKTLDAKNLEAWRLAELLIEVSTANVAVKRLWLARKALACSSELDGDHYEILSPAAEALAAKHPLAATMLLRAMITFGFTHRAMSRNRLPSSK